MSGLLRYFRLLSAFARFSLISEMAFRGNFMMKVLVEVLWLFILLVFYKTLFNAMGDSSTAMIAGWDYYEYLFFIACYYTLEGLIETLFLENATEFAELVRTGNLDQYLLRPIDEQFLISCRKIDWSTAPKILIGAVIMAYALGKLDWPFNAGQVALFLFLFTCGAALAYSFLLMLTSTTVWLMRNQSLMEMWWLFTTVMRYPREIYTGGWGAALGAFFWYLVPVLMVINVPARVIIDKVYDPWNIALMILFTLLMLWLSRLFFLAALRSYRSASS